MRNSKETDRITTEEAARIIGCTPQKVRSNMRTGLWKIGQVEPPPKGKTVWHFYIYRSLVMKLVEGRL